MIGLMCLKELIFIKLMNHVKVLFNYYFPNAKGTKF